MPLENMLCKDTGVEKSEMLFPEVNIKAAEGAPGHGKGERAKHEVLWQFNQQMGFIHTGNSLDNLDRCNIWMQPVGKRFLCFAAGFGLPS